MPYRVDAYEETGRAIRRRPIRQSARLEQVEPRNEQGKSKDRDGDTLHAWIDDDQAARDAGAAKAESPVAAQLRRERERLWADLESINDDIQTCLDAAQIVHLADAYAGRLNRLAAVLTLEGAITRAGDRREK